jgi:hypothetical protein
MRRSASLLAILLLVGCTPTPAPTPSTGEGGVLEVTVVAGPVCPVESEEPDPDCEPRPVPDARVFVQPGDGRDILVAEGTTDDEGRVRIDLPVGDYIVTGGEVEGLFGLPEAVTVSVAGIEPAAATLTYDTGIR